MKLLILLAIFLLHVLTGFGLLGMFRPKIQGWLARVCLAVMAGIAVASFVPFFLQLAYIPLTKNSVFGALLITAVLLNIPNMINRRWLTNEWGGLRWPRLYEWPFLLFICYALIGSAWRCYYLAPQARDLMSGPEAIAAFAMKEQTFINSVFQTDLSTTNNQFKSPFMHSLLLIYKMAGFETGSLWLSQLTFAFSLLVFEWMKRHCHAIVAGILSLLLLSCPEFFAYTYLVLYDYTNALFFFTGYYLLLQYLGAGDRQAFGLSVFFFACSVYVRSETLILVVLLLPLLVYKGYKAGRPFRKSVLQAGILSFSAFLGYFIVIQVYNKHYLPQAYDTNELLNRDLFNLKPLWQRASDVWSTLIVSDWGIILYGYIFYIFFALFALELVFRRRFSPMAAMWLYGIFIVYAGLLLTGFLLPLMDIRNSTKRGLFKVLPLIVLYLSHNYYVRLLSDKLMGRSFEAEKKSPGTGNGSAANKAQQQVSGKLKALQV